MEKPDLTKAISFEAKIVKQGKNTRMITVPKDFWENKIIDDKKIYQVYLIEKGLRKEYLDLYEKIDQNHYILKTEIESYIKNFNELKKDLVTRQTVVIEGNKLKQKPDGNLRDLFNGELINNEENIHFHHIDLNREKNAVDNLCVISTQNNYLIHSKKEKNQSEYEEFQKVLRNNILSIKSGKVPKTWKNINEDRVIVSKN